MKTAFVVVGVPQTLAMFAATAIAGEAAATAYAAGLADSVAALAKTLAPVGEIDGGTLRDSIEADGNRVVATAPYAGFVEYGAEGNNTPAQPFLRPAADTVNDASAITSALAVLKIGLGSRIFGRGT